MKISDFKSSTEFKNFTHALAANSKGKIKAGQLQNSFASLFNFTHPKDLFNHLDSIYNKPFTLGVGKPFPTENRNIDNFAVINFWGDVNIPDNLSKPVSLEFAEDSGALGDFLFKHTDFPYSHFINNLAPTLTKLLEVFDINALLAIPEQHTRAATLVTISDMSILCDYTDKLLENNFLDELESLTSNSGDLELLNNFIYIKEENKGRLQISSTVAEVIAHLIAYTLEVDTSFNQSTFISISPAEQAEILHKSIKTLARDFLFYSISSSHYENTLTSQISELKKTIEQLKKSVSTTEVTDSINTFKKGNPSLENYDDAQLKSTIKEGLIENKTFEFYEQIYINAIKQTQNAA